MPNNANDPQHLSSFSIRLCQWQKELGLTGQAIATALDLPLPLWYRYRAGQHYPKPHLLALLAQLYPLNLHWLLTGHSVADTPPPGHLPDTPRDTPRG